MSTNDNNLAQIEGAINDGGNPLAELMANHQPNDSAVREVMDYINDGLADEQFRKSIVGYGVKFPSDKHAPGMQSVDVDDMQILINGDFIDKPGLLNFQAMRAMVDQTPVLSSIIMTRIRQVQLFTRVQESGTGTGFVIRHKDKDHELTDTEKKSIQLLQDFFTNCGWETNPRRRRQMKRDNFSAFMAKLTRDTLTMDSCAIETEFKRNRDLGLDGLYAVDGATIRLCTEQGYQGDDEIFALQVVGGMVRTAYTYDDLIYEPRNPRTDVLAAGYGMGEVEMLVKTVTGYLNALTYNSKYFDSNSIPKGVLHMNGDFTERDMQAFRRYWNAMVKGVNNSWQLPVMFSKNSESKASFEKFGVDQDEMMFSRWMTFLTAICCAVFGMDPAEINSDAFSAGTSPLSGSDTTARLAASKDKGLRPLLMYFETLFSDFIVREFSDQFVFRWAGLDDKDEDKRFEMDKMTLTWNEGRARQGQDAIEGPMGDAPLNPSLIGPWMQMNQAQQGGDDQEGDFGDPSEQKPGTPSDPNAGADGGEQGGPEAQPPGNQAPPPTDGAPSPQGAGSQPVDEQQRLTKSIDPLDVERFGMPVLKIGDIG